MAERRSDEEERDHRPGDDDVEHQQPHRQREPLEVAEERDAVVEPLGGKAPDRMHHGPEQRREEKAVGGQRRRIAPPHRVLCHQHVDRVSDRSGQRRDDSEPVEREAAPELDDERETDHRQDERQPEPAPDRLLVDRPGPERDQDRSEVLEQQRDPDRQPPDRDEVEPLHECDACDPEDDQIGELASREAQGVASREREQEREAEERSGRAHLRQLERGDPRLEHDLGDGAVQREEERSRDHHRVAEGGPPLAPGLARDIRHVRHRPATLPARYGSTLERSGRGAAW